MEEKNNAAAFAEMPVEKDQLREMLSIQRKQKKMAKEPSANIVRQSPQEILDAQLKAASLFGNNVEEREQNVSRIVRTPLDGLALDKRRETEPLCSWGPVWDAHIELEKILDTLQLVDILSHGASPSAEVPLDIYNGFIRDIHERLISVDEKLSNSLEHTLFPEQNVVLSTAGGSHVDENS